MGHGDAASMKGSQLSMAQGSERLGVADRRNIAWLIIGWLLLWAFIWPVGDFPLNDDWVYGRSVRSILDSGRFRLSEWSQALGFPQAWFGAVISKVFGFSFFALRVFVLSVGLAGVLCTYGLLRQFDSSPATAALGAATVAFNPLYLAMASSFMTDVPFYTLVVATLWLWVRGLQRNDAFLLLIGALLAVLAMLTRQLGLILGLAFAVSILIVRPWNFKTLVIALAPLILSVSVYAVVELSLGNSGRRLSSVESTEQVIIDMTSRFLAKSKEPLKRLGLMFQYVCLFSLPLMVVWFSTAARSFDEFGRLALMRRTGTWVVAFAFLAVLLHRYISMPSAINVIAQHGIGPLTLKDTFILLVNQPKIPQYLTLGWQVVTALSVLAMALFAERASTVVREKLKSWRNIGKWSVDGPTVLLAATASFYVLLVCILVPGYFDRYSLVCVPLVYVLFATPAVAPRIVTRRPVDAGRSGVRLAAWTFVACLMAFSAVSLRDYFVWNAQRWRATEDLQRRGISPRNIDGGYEFNGWHLYDHGGPRSDHPNRSWWWVDDDEYIIASGGLAGYHEIASYPFYRWLTWGHERVVVLKRQ